MLPSQFCKTLLRTGCFSKPKPLYYPAYLEWLCLHLQTLKNCGMVNLGEEAQQRLRERFGL